MKLTSIYLSSPVGLLSVCLFRPSCFVLLWLVSLASFWNWIVTFTAFNAFVIHSLHLWFLSPGWFSCAAVKPVSTTVQFHASVSAPAFHCSTTLGMESGKISDDQITASTTFYDNRWLPRQARLNNNDNAWTPSEDSNKEYIQVRP